ncbi:MAG: TetR family transcriptional regulator [Alphaproteobacteria bacterium]|nr:TetR family transcriptional regulator [Alphaproteobacteria bacterium]
MSDEAEDLLRRLMPDAFTPADATLQERRSASTRLTILDAAIRCLAEHGYAGMTTARVVEMARASRGAVLHHYPSKQALLEATIDYAFYKRMSRYIADVARMTEAERVDANLGVQAHWEGYLTPEYQAYLELHVAARTDEELRRIFIPRARQFDAVWRDEVAKVFPEWSASRWRFDFGTYFARAVHEGMALNREIWNSPELERIMLEFVSAAEIMIREGRLDIRQPGEGEEPEKQAAAR